MFNWICDNIPFMLIVWFLLMLVVVCINKRFWDGIGKDTRDVFPLD